MSEQKGNGGQSRGTNTEKKVRRRFSPGRSHHENEGHQQGHQKQGVTEMPCQHTGERS